MKELKEKNETININELFRSRSKNLINLRLIYLSPVAQATLLVAATNSFFNVPQESSPFFLFAEKREPISGNDTPSSPSNEILLPSLRHLERPNPDFSQCRFERIFESKERSLWFHQLHGSRDPINSINSRNKKHL